ncbi:MAG: redox-regulated ATPase YchF [Dehalococcoidia bacterium]|nr:redox-regulated ATPase YchF [Dehalococcoidia bacterium]
MEIAIVGLPKSGKTTVFNALTHGQAQTGTFSTGVLTPNVGVVKVPDPRLDGLNSLLRPKRSTPAEVTYIDVPLLPRAARGVSPSPQYLATLSKADALAHTVRLFRDERVPYPEDGINPHRDIVTMDLELAFADLTILERRLNKLSESLKGAKASERDLIHREEEILSRIKVHLENDNPLRDLDLTEGDAKFLENFQFLTAKPILILLNIGEDQLPEAEMLEAEYSARYQGRARDVAVLCAQVEMELAQLAPAEAREFRSDMGLEESALDRTIRVSYRLLGLISFFTVVSDEVRAWTIGRNTTAQKAAGKIHTDMERGFIRTEVIPYDDLIKYGSLAEAKKHGAVRLEGKNYPVKDGDVMTILFNV